MLKTVKAPLEVKADAPEGSVRAAFSVFDVIDGSKDVVRPGAFEDGQEVLMAGAHEWKNRPIGKGVVRQTAEHAEFDGEFFLDTFDGEQWYRSVKNAGSLQQWSFGYDVIEAEHGEFKGQKVRFLNKLKLHEVSPVLVGDNEQTHTLAIKSANAAALERHDRLAGRLDETQARVDEALVEAGEKAVWSTSFINSLPDSAFAVVLPGGEKDSEGKTTPRSLRKLPHHGTDGAVDEPHLRNALSREPQADMPEAAHAKAAVHLRRHARAAGIGDAGKAAEAIDFIDAAEAGLKAAPQGSFEQRSERLRLALADRLGGPFGEGYGYIVATYDDHVIACVYADGMDSYWSIDYALDADGMPTLGDASEVEQTFVPSAAKGLAYAAHAEQALACLREWGERTKSLAGLRAKEGRVLSEANRTRLGALAESMRAVLADVDDLLTATERKPADETSATGDGDEKASPAALDALYLDYLATVARLAGAPV